MACQSSAGLAFSFAQASGETLYLITGSVKFQADVAIDDKSLVAECRVLVNTPSRCFGLPFSSFFAHSSPSFTLDAVSSPAPPFFSVTPLSTRWGVPQRAPVSQNTVMRMLIVYDSKRCAHQGRFGALNGDQNLQLHSVISLDSHSPFSVPNLDSSPDRKNLRSVYVVDHVQIISVSSPRSHVLL